MWGESNSLQPEYRKNIYDILGGYKKSKLVEFSVFTYRYMRTEELMKIQYKFLQFFEKRTDINYCYQLLTYLQYPRLKAFFP